MQNKKILLVEDEITLADLIKLNLTIEGYEVLHTENGKKAIEIFKQKNPGLVILDIMLPELNGIEVCKQLKKLKPEVPVLFLSAKSSGNDRIEGLKSGADDYLTKPFNLEELLLRVQILNKRFPGIEKEDVYTFNNFEINFSSFEVQVKNGQKIELSNREIHLLKLLISRENQVVSRNDIILNLWTPDENPSARTIDNYILNFRKIFEEDSKQPRHFHSIRGIGYKFTAI
ncbi:MAG: response regulator transcription factor [Bacteroidota bacterium]|nr:response regulator transcription factor [Bacteroidota bacterium]